MVSSGIVTDETFRDSVSVYLVFFVVSSVLSDFSGVSVDGTMMVGMMLAVVVSAIVVLVVVLGVVLAVDEGGCWVVVVVVEVVEVVVVVVVVGVVDGGDVSSVVVVCEIVSRCDVRHEKLG